MFDMTDTFRLASHQHTHTHTHFSMRFENLEYIRVADNCPSGTLHCNAFLINKKRIPVTYMNIEHFAHCCRWAKDVGILRSFVLIFSFSIFFILFIYGDDDA